MQKNCSTQFTGHKTYKLDPKGRVSFPSNWKTGGDAIFKLIHAEREGYPVLKFYTEDSFNHLINNIRTKSEAANCSEREITNFIGHILGDCADAELNSQGKLLISKEEREKIGLDDQVVLVGRGDYYELWEPAAYNTVYKITKPQHMELDRMFGIFS